MTTLNSILLVEDEITNRVGMSVLLTRKGFTVWETDNVEQAQQMVIEKQPHVCIIDIQIPLREGQRGLKKDKGGIQLARQIKAQYPTIGVVIFSAHDEYGRDFVELTDQRVRGIAYILKGSHPQHLLAAIETVHAGRIYRDPEISNLHWKAEVFLEQFTGEEQKIICEIAQHIQNLSNREMAVAQLVKAGYRTEGIATKLSLQPKSVEKHITAIYEKFGLHALSLPLRPDVMLAHVLSYHALKTGIA